jgi:antibiotic biosynthesis monooxygenase (ABM) superfamily enzyme
MARRPRKFHKMVFLHIKNEVTGDHEVWDMTDQAKVKELMQEYPAIGTILSQHPDREEGLRVSIRYLNGHHMRAWMSDEQAA